MLHSVVSLQYVARGEWHFYTNFVSPSEIQRCAPLLHPERNLMVGGWENRVGDVKEGEGESRGSRSSKDECAESGSEEKQQDKDGGK